MHLYPLRKHFSVILICAFAAFACIATLAASVAGHRAHGAESNSLPFAAASSSNDLDTSFNGTGKFSYSAYGNHTVAATVASAIQSDGKVVLALTGDISITGGSTDGVYAIRSNPDGSVDSTFGNNGILTMNIGSFESVAAVAIQPDGKILVCGSRYSGSTSNDFFVVRLLTNGTPDTSFHGNGLATVSFYAQSDDYASDMRLQSDGRIVVGGMTNQTFGGSDWSWAVVRLNADGYPDASFGNGGIVVMSFGGLDETVNGIALVNGSEPVLCGNASSSSTSDIVIAKLTAGGLIDTSFGSGGSIAFDIGNTKDVCSSLIHRKNGGFLTGGSYDDGTSTKPVLIALQENGSVDPNFGVSGVAKPAGIGSNAKSLVEQNDNKFLVLSPLGVKAVVTRFASNGAIDTEFGVSGSTSVVIGTSGPIGLGNVSLQADGKIVATAVSSASMPWNYSAFRLNGGSRSRAAADFDGDGKSDESVFRPSNGTWYLNRSQAGFTGYQFGTAGDFVTPADFTGDGKTDVAVFRPSNGTWFIMRSEDNTFYGAQFGANGDIPAPGDYDGDGKADTAVFRPSTGTWFLDQSTAGFSAVTFGVDGDVPTVGDFDGDGKSDVAVFRGSNGAWYRLNSSNGSFFGDQFGQNGDKVVPADYTGDGKTDLAIWRPSNGTWYIRRSEDNSFYGAQFGVSGDLPAPGDYDGDGKADTAVFRPSTGTWFEQRSTTGFAAVGFGVNGDLPAPGAFAY